MGSSIKHFKTASSGTLSARDIAANFDDLHPKFSEGQAVIEASRCLYCFDAPCLQACPTSINIPKFIRQIYAHDAQGAATTILTENILGGTCARACPTEELCEEVCVVNETEGAPVKIGQLQRYAVDELIEKARDHPFSRAPETGVTFAVIGAGPAGLAFAHRFAMLGNAVVIFERQEKSGGLNEYGLAGYKMANEFAQREVDFLLKIGGIEIRHGYALGENLSLKALQAAFDGVFIGVGLGAVADLPIPGANLLGVEDAVDFIERLRQAPSKPQVAIGSKIVVIGGGNTAIDAAVQARCLGAQTVTLAYRRGVDAMGATDFEQDLAAANGVTILYWAAPRAIIGTDRVERVILDKTEDNAGLLKCTDETIDLAADTVLLAIGQTLADKCLSGLSLSKGKIDIDSEYRTSLPWVYAGGDCTATGADLTVQAIEDGKQAAICADAHLRSAVFKASQ